MGLQSKKPNPSGTSTRTHHGMRGSCESYQRSAGRDPFPSEKPEKGEIPDPAAPEAGAGAGVRDSGGRRRHGAGPRVLEVAREDRFGGEA